MLSKNLTANFKKLMRTKSPGSEEKQIINIKVEPGKICLDLKERTPRITSVDSSKKI